MLMEASVVFQIPSDQDEKQQPHSISSTRFRSSRTPIYLPFLLSDERYVVRAALGTLLVRHTKTFATTPLLSPRSGDIPLLPLRT